MDYTIIFLLLLLLIERGKIIQQNSAIFSNCPFLTRYSYTPSSWCAVSFTLLDETFDLFYCTFLCIKWKCIKYLPGFFNCHITVIMQCLYSTCVFLWERYKHFPSCIFAKSFHIFTLNCSFVKLLHDMKLFTAFQLVDILWGCANPCPPPPSLPGLLASIEILQKFRLSRNTTPAPNSLWSLY